MHVHVNAYSYMCVSNYVFIFMYIRVCISMDTCLCMYLTKECGAIHVYVCDGVHKFVGASIHEYSGMRTCAVNTYANVCIPIACMLALLSMPKVYMAPSLTDA